MDTILMLADGRVFAGRGFGAREIAIGEVVFNTSMTGYQEILTDPSYHDQLVCMTQPLIGNYGVNEEDVESHNRAVQARGFVVRQASPYHSNHRATSTLAQYLVAHKTAGIEGVDTRALTRHIRDRGAMPGALAPADTDRDELLERIRAWGTMEGRELASKATCAEAYSVSATSQRFSIAAYDYGAKRSIFRHMAARGLSVRVFPANTPPAELLASKPDGIFLSNGPGDPAACAEAIKNIRALLGKLPIWGICLGHQLLALALGARTYKLPFGHHGGNHPVKDLSTGRIEITAQNHGFAVEEASLSECGASVSHRNLNDGSVEGLTMPQRRLQSVQYHPEAAPGPHDSHYLFDRFVGLLERA